MKTFVSTHTYQHLNLDARHKPDRARVVLNIADKHDPDSWYMTFSENKVDNFVTYLRKGEKQLTATLFIQINSAERLSFAKPGTASNNHVFAGVLFAAGNHELREFEAVESEFENEDLLRLTIIPSKFWECPTKGKNSEQSGTKIGFRFVVNDRQGEVFFSHDPMVIVPDWEPT